MLLDRLSNCQGGSVRCDVAVGLRHCDCAPTSLSVSFYGFLTSCWQVISSIIFSPVVYFLVGFSTSNNGGRFFIFMAVGVCA